MSADIGGLGWRAGSSDTILKGDHPRTIPPKFGPNWSSSFREIFDNFFGAKFSIFSHGGHLGWWAGLVDTNLKGDHTRTILAKFGPNWHSGFRGED